MRTISQIELKRLKKKGTVRRKLGAQTEKQSESAASVSTEKSGSNAAEQPTLTSVMTKMADILDRMDKRTAGEPVTTAEQISVEKLPKISELPTLESLESEIEEIPFKPLTFAAVAQADEPVVRAPDERKRVMEIEPGWTQKVARDKKGYLSKVEMNAPGTDVRYVFTPKRAKNGIIESVLMDTVGPKGRKSSNRLIVNRDSNQLISGLSLQQA
jgi:hypothetical protein